MGHSYAATLTTLSRADRDRIIEMRKAGGSLRAIADALNLADHVVSLIASQAPLAAPVRPRRPICPEDYPELREKLEMAIAELPLAARTVGTLERLGILYVSELVAWRAEELAAVKYVKGAMLQEIFAALEGIGLRREPSEATA